MSKKEEPADRYQLASAIARQVELLDVWLQRVEAQLHVDRGACLGALPWTAELSKAVRVEYVDATRVLAVDPDLCVRARPAKATTAAPLFTVRGVFRLEYELGDAPAGAEARRRHFDAFAQLNGVHTAWPYFRELVHSTVARIGLPPLVVPVQRLEPG